MHPTARGIAILALASLFALPAAADTQFRIRKMTAGNGALGKGQCEIRLRVSGEAEVTVRRDVVSIHTLAGRDPLDDGSECNAPLPEREMPEFHFEVRTSRAEMRLLAPPSPGNDFAAVVLIHDTAAGMGRYHFRLTWEIRAIDLRRDEERRPATVPGFAWNNALHFAGAGRGVATFGGAGQKLLNVTVDIDRGGRVVVLFRAESKRQLSFTGSVTGKDGSTWKTDVVSEDRRLRGPMLLSVDDRDRVKSITLEAGDGRDRVRLTWDRR